MGKWRNIAKQTEIEKRSTEATAKELKSSYHGRIQWGEEGRWRKDPGEEWVTTGDMRFHSYEVIIRTNMVGS